MSSGCSPAFLQRHAHRQLGAAALRMRRGDVIGVAGQAVADDLGVDFRAARLGMLIFLEHDDARALAHDEAFAVLVVGPAGLLGPVVEGGVERARLGKAGDAERVDRALRAAGEHDVGIAVLDHPRGVADRVRAGRAGGDDRMVRAHQPIFDRDLARREVDQPAVNEMRADPPRPLFGEHQRFALDARQAADARADRDAGALLEVLVHVGEAGILERLAGGVDRIDDERVDLALDLVVDALVGIEPIRVILGLNLAGDLRLMVAGVEAGDRRRSRSCRR